jgi:branched-chain amino acid transport system substrate-binding protein
MTRIMRTALLTVALAAASMTTAAAQDLLLGYLPASGGPFATFSKTNAIAAQMAIDEINSAGGVNGKKLRIVEFDTAGKPDQAVVGLRKLADDDKVLAIIGPFSSSECRVVFPAGERAGIDTMSMASSRPSWRSPSPTRSATPRTKATCSSACCAPSRRKTIRHRRRRSLTRRMT